MSQYASDSMRGFVLFRLTKLQKAGAVPCTLINLSSYEAGELIVEHNLN